MYLENVLNLALAGLRDRGISRLHTVIWSATWWQSIGSVEGGLLVVRPVR